MVRRRPHYVACVLLVVLVLSGCSSTQSGSGVAGPTGRPSSTRASKSGASGGAGTFPRTPFSTAIGDPATADVCTAIPPASFAGLRGYTAVYDGEVSPPGCTVRVEKAGQVQFSVLAYGVAPSSFSHLGPPHVGKLARSTSIDGIQVKYYVYAPKPIGDCARDVLADGVTFKIDVLGSSDDANTGSIGRVHCAAADAMTKDLATAAAAHRFARLKLASPSLTRIDFCAALRSVKPTDLDDFAGAVASVDGVGDGCQLIRGSALMFYLDFEVRPTAVPDSSKAVVVDGHHLYASTADDQTSYCSYTSVQSRTPAGRYEAITATSNYTASGGPSTKKLCTETATVVARFLDAADLR